MMTGHPIEIIGACNTPSHTQAGRASFADDDDNTMRALLGSRLPVTPVYALPQPSCRTALCLPARRVIVSRRTRCHAAPEPADRTEIAHLELCFTTVPAGFAHARHTRERQLRPVSRHAVYLARSIVSSAHLVWLSAMAAAQGHNASLRFSSHGLCAQFMHTNSMLPAAFRSEMSQSTARYFSARIPPDAACQRQVRNIACALFSMHDSLLYALCCAFALE